MDDGYNHLHKYIIYFNMWHTGGIGLLLYARKNTKMIMV